MSRLLDTLQRWGSNPYVELLLGLFVTASGLGQIDAEEAVGAHHGLVLLGSFQVLRALDGLLEGAELTATAVAKFEVRRHRRWSIWLHRVLHSSAFRVALGAAILLAALADAWDDAAKGDAASWGHWKLGLMLVGLMVVFEAMAGVLGGLEALGKRSEGTGPVWLLLERAEGRLRRPWVELSVAASLLGLSLMEELRVDATGPQPHLGLMAFGVQRLMVIVPRLRTSAVLVAEVVQRRAGGREPTHQDRGDAAKETR